MYVACNITVGSALTSLFITVHNITEFGTSQPRENCHDHAEALKWHFCGGAANSWAARTRLGDIDAVRHTRCNSSSNVSGNVSVAVGAAVCTAPLMLQLPAKPPLHDTAPHTVLVCPDLCANPPWGCFFHRHMTASHKACRSAFTHALCTIYTAYSQTLAKQHTFHVLPCCTCLRGMIPLVQKLPRGLYQGDTQCSDRGCHPSHRRRAAPALRQACMFVYYTLSQLHRNCRSC